MNKTMCEDLTDLVKAQFEFLFSDHGFELEHVQEASSGERCLLILQGPFRIKFLYGPGDLEVLVGRLDAPATWAATVDGVRCWLQFWGVLRYVAGTPKLDTAELMKLGKRYAAMDQESYLAELANSMRTQLAKITSFFASPEYPEELKRFEDYLYD